MDWSPHAYLVEHNPKAVDIISLLEALTPVFGNVELGGRVAVEVMQPVLALKLGKLAGVGWS